MNNFEEMGLSPVLMQALEKLGFTQPTVIQAKTIPLALQGKDILGSAQTGTGKTLAFTLPLVNNLLKNPEGIGLILTPTRELAQQVNFNVKQLLTDTPSIKTALLIGGESYDKQLIQLKNKPRIIIGTPGRIIDHLERNRFKPQSVNFLVLDETDRMFDMGFSEQLQQIVEQISAERQTLMFSATFPVKIEKLAAKYTKQPERVFTNDATSVGMVAQNLTQEILEINEGGKYLELLTQLNSREGSLLVFVKTKSDAEQLALSLEQDDHDACAIHGNLKQNKRERVMRAFRQGRHRIMVATDIAARGLDVPHVMHVINYDIPHAPEDYIHRIGRTARAGKKGSAISFVSPQDRKRWDAIQELLDPEKYKANKKAFSNNNTRNFNSKSARVFSKRDAPASSFNRGNSSEGRPRRDSQGANFRSKSSEGRPRIGSQESNSNRGGFLEDRPRRDFSEGNFNRGGSSEDRPRRNFSGDNFNRSSSSEGRPRRDAQGGNPRDGFSEGKPKRDFQGNSFRSDSLESRPRRDAQGGSFSNNFSEGRPKRDFSGGNFRGGASEGKPRDFQIGSSVGSKKPKSFRNKKS